MEKKQIKFILANTYPFNKLDSEQLEKLIDLSEIKEYKNGDVVYSEGALPDHFYMLVNGRVVVSTKQEDKEKEIEVLKRGTSFGIISLFTGDPHSVTVRSIETSIVLRVEKYKFKDFLNLNPLISLDFSRILSQRVKKRTQPKTIFKSKKIGIMGCRNAGKTTYMGNLGLKLKEQTFKKVICVEASCSDDFTLVPDGRNILDLNGFDDSSVFRCLVKRDIDYLMVKVDQADKIVSLLNFLSEHYHFILYEIPYDSLDKDFEAFMVTASSVHILLFPEKEDLLLGRSVIEELKAKKTIAEEKIKVILCEYAREDRLSFEEKRQCVGHPIYATLPSQGKSDYGLAVRRLARETGEVITGIALGGGGAFSFSHIGVLKVLQDNDIPVDVISGTSIGSLIAGLWAAGFDLTDMIKITREFGRILRPFCFVGMRFPFKGLMQAKRLEGFLKKVFKDITFYDLKHTLRITTFDFLERDSRVLDEGPLYKAVAASCAYPGIFEPVKFKKNILMDGGILDPLPTKVLFNYGANKIIASNINPSREEILRWHKDKSKLHVLDFIFGSIETMQREFIYQAVKMADVVVHPDLEGLGWLEFEKVEDFVQRGERAAREKLEELKRLAGA